MAMRRRWIIGTIVGVGALGALAAGVALAASPADGTGGTGLRDRVIDKAAAILGIESSKLDDALVQANREVAAEQRDARIQDLVDAGKLTHEQADQLKSWLDSKPDGIDGVLPGFGFGQFGPDAGPGFLIPKRAPLGPGPIVPFHQFRRGPGHRFNGGVPFEWKSPPVTPTPAPDDSTNTSI